MGNNFQLILTVDNLNELSVAKSSKIPVFTNLIALYGLQQLLVSFEYYLILTLR